MEFKGGGGPRERCCRRLRGSALTPDFPMERAGHKPRPLPAYAHGCQLSMGIEYCRVLGTESGRVGPLSRVGSVASGAGRPPGSAGVSPAFVSAQPGPSPPTRLERQSHQGSASAGFTPFLPAGLLGAPSQAFCVVRYGSACGRDARAPGWACLPQCSRHSLPFSSNAARPAIAPGLCFGRAHAVPVGGVGGRYIVGILSETLRQCGRVGRPRSRVGPFVDNSFFRGVATGLPTRRLFFRRFPWRGWGSGRFLRR